MLRKRAYPWFLIILLSFLVALAMLTRPAQANPGSWQWKYQVWMPKHWQNLAQCEAGMNWQHNSGAFQGAFGFAPSTWDGWRPKRYPHAAYLATPWQQYQVALRVAADPSHPDGIQDSWGCWRGPGHAWVRNGLPEYGTRK